MCVCVCKGGEGGGASKLMGRLEQRGRFHSEACHAYKAVRPVLKICTDATELETWDGMSWRPQGLVAAGDIECLAGAVRLALNSVADEMAERRPSSGQIRLEHHFHAPFQGFAILLSYRSLLTSSVWRSAAEVKRSFDSLQR